MALSSRQAMIWSLGAGLAAFGLDRIHKYLQVEIWGWRGGEFVTVTPFFDYVLVWNTGISYGLLNGLPPLVLLGIMGLAMVLLAFWWVRAGAPLVRLGLAVCLGGAASHLVDRLIYGAVPDFFHFHWGQWSFYVFNISDTAITLGVGLLLIDLLMPKQAREG